MRNLIRDLRWFRRAASLVGAVALAIGMVGCVETERIDPSTEFRLYDMIPVSRRDAPGGTRYLEGQDTAPRLYHEDMDVGPFQPGRYIDDTSGPWAPTPYRFE